MRNSSAGRNSLPIRTPHLFTQATATQKFLITFPFILGARLINSYPRDALCLFSVNCQRLRMNTRDYRVTEEVAMSGGGLLTRHIWDTFDIERAYIMRRPWVERRDTRFSAIVDMRLSLLILYLAVTVSGADGGFLLFFRRKVCWVYKSRKRWRLDHLNTNKNLCRLQVLLGHDEEAAAPTVHWLR